MTLLLLFFSVVCSAHATGSTKLCHRRFFKSVKKRVSLGHSFSAALITRWLQLYPPGRDYSFRPAHFPALSKPLRNFSVMSPSGAGSRLSDCFASYRVSAICRYTGARPSMQSARCSRTMKGIAQTTSSFCLSAPSARKKKKSAMSWPFPTATKENE